MVQINFARKEINCKIVYYGPGLSGKTTSLEVVHQKTPSGNKGDLTSISTDGDRTLFFDFMPLDLGSIAGMQTKFHLYTVPGQVYYNSTRKLVLMGADGIIFVADSSPGRINDNLQSIENLKENLAEMGRDISKIPLVLQYNKRDVPNASSVEELNNSLNPMGRQFFESSAKTGEGVFQALKAISSVVLDDINTNEKRVPTRKKGKGKAKKRAAPAAGGAANPTAPAAATSAPASGGGTAKPTPQPEQQMAAAASAQQPAAGASAGTATATKQRPKTKKRAPAAKPVVKTRAKTKRAKQTPAADAQEPMEVVEPRAERPRVRGSQKQAAPPAQKASNGKIVIFMILGILAGAAVAVVAAKFLLGDILGK